MLVVTARKSLVQATILLIAWLGTLYALSICDLNWLLLASMALLACYCFALELYRCLGYGSNSLRAICLHERRGRLIYADRQIQVGPLRISYFSEFLIVLDFASKGMGKSQQDRSKFPGGIWADNPGVAI